MLQETAAAFIPETTGAEPDHDELRRQIITPTGRLADAPPVAAAQRAAGKMASAGANPPDVKLPPLEAPTDPKGSAPFNPDAPDRRVGYAVVGLGHLTLDEILPAFGRCKHAKLTALVSGDAEKLRQVARQYSIDPGSCYSYQTYDALKDNPAVEVIYIVLPNSMHHEFTLRGAQAGKHILCEKPMANSVKECEEMIAACQKAGKKLMIAYRIQYEPLNRLAQQAVRANTYGATKLIQMVNCQNQAHDQQWRHQKALAGGGALPDIGLYCLNTTRFLLGEEPIEVTAQVHSTPGDARFREVEENVAFTLRFPSGVLAQCLTGYGSFAHRAYTVHAETGRITMDPAFAYQGLRQERAHAPHGTEVKETHANPQVDQFALEMDHMAACVRHNKTPYTPGEEGLQDQRLMESIYQSARENKPVKLPVVARLDAFRGEAPTEDEA